MQLHINQNLKKAAPGMMTGDLHNRSIDSRLANEIIYVGKAVTPCATTELNSDLRKVKLPTSAAEVARTEGVSIWSPAMASEDDLNYAQYLAGEMVSVLRKDDIWVEVGNVITNLDDPVLVKRANGNLVQVFELTIQAGAVADKVYSFTLQHPDGSTTLISHTAVDDDETLVATGIAALITAITGISAAAVSNVVTCTAGNAGERWKCLDLVATDIVLTGETTPTVGTLGSFRSQYETYQVQTLTHADTAASGKVINVDIEGPDGTRHSIAYTETGATEATECTAIAALINAISGLTSSAATNVITITADNINERWKISQSADLVLAETTVTDFSEWKNAKWIGYEEIDGVFFGLLRVN
jgi:hypothetical protein